MLIVENESPGLRIIQTDAYKRLIDNNPGFIHENMGDFYSEVPVNNLADAVNNTLEMEYRGKKLNQNLVTVDASRFDPLTHPEAKNYLIKEIDGIRFYFPPLHTSDARFVSLTYGLIGVMVVEKIVSKEKQGSLQEQLRDLGDLEQIVRSTLRT